KKFLQSDEPPTTCPREFRPITMAARITPHSAEIMHLAVPPQNCIMKILSGQISRPWSPDGRSIAFGRLPGLETLGKYSGSSNIEILNLKTGQRSKVQGSEGLFSPRWSPDGRYLVALKTTHPMRPQLFAFATQKWAQ